MENVYIICIMVGIAIPLIIAVFNVIDGFVDFFAFDCFNLDIGDMEFDFLPLSLNALCLASLIFGGTGYLLSQKFSLLTANIAAGLIAYISAVILQSSVSHLKKYENLSIDESILLLCKGVVQNKIPAGGYGSVCINLPNSSNVSYPAKSEDGSEIPQDTIVSIVAFDRNQLIVKPEDSLEQKYKE